MQAYQLSDGQFIMVKFGICYFFTADINQTRIEAHKRRLLRTFFVKGKFKIKNLLSTNRQTSKHTYKRIVRVSWQTIGRQVFSLVE